MAKPVSITVTGVAASAAIPLDRKINPFWVGIYVRLSATATYNVEGTLDDIYAAGWTEASGNWFSLPGFNALTVATANLLDFPVTAIRLNVTASTGTATLQALQAGPGA
jgi:hypothetical protein